MGRSPFRCALLHFQICKSPRPDWFRFATSVLASRFFRASVVGGMVAQSGSPKNLSKGTLTMVKKSKVEDYEDTIRDIYDTVEQAGTTRAEMESALDSIRDLCTNAVEDLAESENEDEDEDE
jgi:hypothetical protein